MSRITSRILILMGILSIILFLLGLLHFLMRYIIKFQPFPSISYSRSFRDASDQPGIQLQHLFRQHDSGLDQALVEALPVFHYKEIVGLKEPFDCAVCLSEFLENDELKLLVYCSHAFHVCCIETWLMSNSTCPLCRSWPISSDVPRRSSSYSLEGSVSRIGAEILRESAVCVRLGKFRGSREEGDGSSSSFDGRRCYSMGEFHYIVGEEKLRVNLCEGNWDVKNEGENSVWSKGESLSMSKIWLWSKKKEFRRSSQLV